MRHELDEKRAHEAAARALFKREAKSKQVLMKISLFLSHSALPRGAQPCKANADALRRQTRLTVS